MTTLHKQVEQVLSELSFDEKFTLISGQPHWFFKGNKRLGVPALQTANGPSGVRPYLKSPNYPEGVVDIAKTTAYPAGIALAATWNRDTVEEVGRTIANECNEKGVDVLLGPCVCLVRLPVGGRNFESYGEDPVLAGKLAAGYITGVQSKGVAATIKHFVCNDTEYKRHSIDIHLSQRTLHELYLRPFEIAIREANPWSVMTSYNFVNGVRVCDSRSLQTELLKEKWGFDGFVMSDWGAVYSAEPTFAAGMDLDMPRGKHFASAELKEIVAASNEYRKLLDDKVRRLVRFALARKQYLEETPLKPLSLQAKRQTARNATRESIVLLKNRSGILPLDPDRTNSIVVLGPNADVLRTGGGGSSYVCPERAPSPLAVLRERYSDAIDIRHEPGVRRERDIFPVDPKQLYLDDTSERHGVRVEYFNNTECNGAPCAVEALDTISRDWVDLSPASGIYPSYFSSRFTTVLVPEESGERELKLLALEGARLWIDDELVIDLWTREGHHQGATKWSKMNLDTARFKFEKGRPYHVRVEHYNSSMKSLVALGWEPARNDLLGAALAAAENADLAIVFAGTAWYDETEGRDLKSPWLPDGQDEFINKVAAANPNTIVVLNNGGPLLIDNWNDNVAALVEAWFPGQEGGAAIADVLFGETNPSGKLPFTFFRRWSDNPAHATYPKQPESDAADRVEDIDTVIEHQETDHPTIEYREGLFLGYRYTDKHDVTPLYPFGFGMSYTGFEIAECRLSSAELRENQSLELEITVKNTGNRTGAQVVQVYFGPAEPAPERPIKQLVAFDKVQLEPGNEKRIELAISRHDITFYDETDGDWAVVPGNYRLFVGTAADDIVHTLPFACV